MLTKVESIFSFIDVWKFAKNIYNQIRWRMKCMKIHLNDILQLIKSINEEFELCI